MYPSYAHNEELRVVIGAGQYNNNPDWILTQESELNLLMRYQWVNRFSPNSISAILAEHVWEHLKDQDPLIIRRRAIKLYTTINHYRLCSELLDLKLICWSIAMKTGSFIAENGMKQRDLYIVPNVLTTEIRMAIYVLFLLSLMLKSHVKKLGRRNGEDIQ